MYPKKGWILAAALLILCSVGCTGQTGETHRMCRLLAQNRR